MHTRTIQYIKYNIFEEFRNIFKFRSNHNNKSIYSVFLKTKNKISIFEESFFSFKTSSKT